jgi:peptidoglycan-associated lipoprotein
MNHPKMECSMKSKRFFPRLLLILLASVLLVGLGACSSRGKKGAMDGDEMGLSELDLAARREARFADGSIPSAEGEGIFRDVRFDFDSYEIGDAGRQNIEYNVEVLKQNEQVRIQLEGHTDERGTTEYNLALGERRAGAVRDILISYGIPASRLETISFGEEIPLVLGHNEEAWSMNRRVHFAPKP